MCFGWLLFYHFLLRWDVSIRVVGPQDDRSSQVFIFGESADVEGARDWLKSWIGLKDIWKENKERDARRRPGESSLERKERECDGRDAARRGTNRGEMDEGAVRSSVPPRGNLVSKLLSISGQYTESPSPQPDLRAKLEKQRKQNKEEAGPFWYCRTA